MVYHPGHQQFFLTHEKIRVICQDGLFYTQVSAGAFHTVLLRSDGCAVACGENGYGECEIPPLDHGLSFAQVGTV
jgi:alpha-tubulin suppressor-like RCC1 family protein